MLHQADEKRNTEATLVRKKIADRLGRNTPSQGLIIINALMAIDFARTHGEEASIDFVKRNSAFTQMHPLPARSLAEVIPQDKVLDEAIVLGAEISTLKVHSRAVQIALWSVVCFTWEYLYNKTVAQAWTKMMWQWARQRDSTGPAPQRSNEEIDAVINQANKPGAETVN